MYCITIVLDTTFAPSLHHFEAAEGRTFDVRLFDRDCSLSPPLCTLQQPINGSVHLDF